MEKKKLVVFTGAGVSADSGIATFRDADGLWANYRIEDVCTPEALARNREQVIGFYNMRRRELLASKPNAGHYALAGLEDVFDVRVITQNIDDLHERAGSRQVLHLHGELRKLRSTVDERLVFPIEGWEQKPDDSCGNFACRLSCGLARKVRARWGSGLSCGPGRTGCARPAQSQGAHPDARCRRTAAACGPSEKRDGLKPLIKRKEAAAG